MIGVRLPLPFNGGLQERGQMILRKGPSLNEGLWQIFEPTVYDNNPLTLLNLRRLPARVDCQGAGVLLNFEEVSIRALVEMGLLKPAGHAKGNERKYFCAKTILKLAEDEKWIGDATRAVSRYWFSKNERRKASRRDQSEPPVDRSIS
jgi:hypothetical protein